MEIFTSVIIPTYNRADLVRESVESVLRQSYPSVEIIVIDDGSTDQTKEVLKEYIDSNKIVYHWRENAGRSEARNYGARISKGEFLLFLDSDDLLDEKAIENLQQLAVKHPNSGVFSGLVGFFSKNEPADFDTPFNYREVFSDKQVGSEVVRKIFLSIGGFIVRRDVFFNNGGFKKEFEPAEDLDFSLKTLHATLYTWSRDFKVVSKRRHEGNTDDINLSAASRRICKYYLEELKNNRLPRFNKEKRKMTSHFYERVFDNCINLGLKREGSVYFGKMLGKDISKIFSWIIWRNFFYLLLVK